MYPVASYEKDIDTLEELVKTGLPIGTTSRSLGNIFTGDHESPLIDLLETKFTLLNKSNAPIINRTAYARDICSIERLSDIPANIAVNIFF